MKNLSKIIFEVKLLRIIIKKVNNSVHAFQCDIHDMHGDGVDKRIREDRRVGWV